eukprot:scaffold7340_cov266-Pinguiococcus_pyrenoidosus.AAC.90
MTAQGRAETQGVALPWRRRIVRGVRALEKRRRWDICSFLESGLLALLPHGPCAFRNLLRHADG